MNMCSYLGINIHKIERLNCFTPLNYQKWITSLFIHNNLDMFWMNHFESLHWLCSLGSDLDCLLFPLVFSFTFNFGPIYIGKQKEIFRVNNLNEAEKEFTLQFAKSEEVKSWVWDFPLAWRENEADWWTKGGWHSSAAAACLSNCLVAATQHSLLPPCHTFST